MASKDDKVLELPIEAYELYSQADMPVIPAPISRQWMDETQMRFAYRCLPLTLANQAGWLICNPVSFCARWNGGPRVEDVVLAFDQVPPDTRISSLFGHGTITWNIPYLFRTPEGINLWVKGPTNWPKDAVQALEGLVETDWTAASFTMNWKITRPNHLVRFERGEPICMVLPFPRGMLEICEPRRLPIGENVELSEAYRRWSDERNEFHKRVADGDFEAIQRGWQKDYFQGRDPGSEKFDAHQTKIPLKHFRRETADENET